MLIEEIDAEVMADGEEDTQDDEERRTEDERTQPGLPGVPATVRARPTLWLCLAPVASRP